MSSDRDNWDADKGERFANRCLDKLIQCGVIEETEDMLFTHTAEYQSTVELCMNKYDMDLDVAIIFSIGYQLGLFDTKLQFTYDELEACRTMLRKPFEEEKKQPVSIISKEDEI